MKYIHAKCINCGITLSQRISDEVECNKNIIKFVAEGLAKEANYHCMYYYVL
jgi:hypothetical protein